MRAEAQIAPAPAPDVHEAIELALAATARGSEASATRSAWWHAGLAEQRAAGSSTTLVRAAPPRAPVA